mmetsp:Transcript_3755/g.10997  ORF Transcript_3755/g.10997 Transcript_3755/m.10997 type:complete len:86 (+) Transcript_3755:241-498(+)
MLMAVMGSPPPGVDMWPSFCSLLSSLSHFSRHSTQALKLENKRVITGKRQVKSALATGAGAAAVTATMCSFPYRKTGQGSQRAFG